MKKIKSLSTIALAFLMLFSMAACGGGSDTPSSPDNSKPADAKPGEAKPADSKPEAPKIDLKGATIRIACYWECDPAKMQPQTEVTELKVAKQKEVEQKYNVKIEYLMIPYQEVVQKTTTTALSGEPFADIIRIEHQNVPGLIAGGYLKPINEYIDPNDKQISAAVRTVGTYGSKQYGFLDNVVDGAGIFYNKAILKREGLEDPYELMKNNQWTWDKFLELAKKATKDTNGDGKIDQYGIASWDQEFATFLIHSNGGKVFDSASGKIGFDGPNAMEALEFMNKLYHVDKVVMPSEGDPYSHPKTVFAAGKVLFTTGYTWEGMLRKDPKKMADDYGYVYMPKGPKAKDYVVPLGQTNMFYIPANAKYPKESIQIWKELVIWDRVVQDQEDFLDLAFRSKEDIKTAKEMPSKLQVDYYLAFPELKTKFFSMATKIAKGEEPPVTAVEKVKQEAQAGVDAAVKK